MAAVKDIGINVSIHAPVWGAKGTFCQVAPPSVVSIHAPVWGANKIDTDDQLARPVSIHAPVWGAKRPC